MCTEVTSHIDANALEKALEIVKVLDAVESGKACFMPCEETKYRRLLESHEVGKREYVRRIEAIRQSERIGQDYNIIVY